MTHDLTPEQEIEKIEQTAQAIANLKKQEEVVGGYDQKKYTTKRMYATARDGKIIPISIVYRIDKKEKQPQNLLLYAYGVKSMTRPS